MRNNAATSGSKVLTRALKKSDGALSSVGEQFGEIARETMSNVGKVLEEGKSAAKDQYHATRKWVGIAAKKNPVRAMGIAAFVGVVAGIFLGRR